MNSGYSGTPLEKKLGIKENFVCLLYQAPKSYKKWFNNLQLNLKCLDETEKESTNFIHLFCTTFEELETALTTYKYALKKDGLMWISWPKGSSTIVTDLKRDMIRTYVLKSGLVDVKVAAVDDDWSGLKFVYRLKDRT